MIGIQQIIVKGILGNRKDMITKTEGDISKMSSYERSQRYEFEKNQLLAAMKGHTADEIQRALQILIEKWGV